jgi:hypothetical protein
MGKNQDPGSGMVKNQDPGSGINITDPQHCISLIYCRRDEMDHVMVFFSSYCDFVRVRNWFKASNLDYAEVSEYTKDSRMAKVSSNRASLVTGA